MVGTLNVPPPIPIIAEIAPMNAGISAPGTPPGSDGRSTTRSSGSNILSADNNATVPKTAASTLPFTCAAASEPASAPTTIGTAQRFTTAKSTALRLAWAREDEMAVGTMVAMDVATATWSETA